MVLQIARRLKALIEREHNMKVYMTRNEDVFIPLKVRVAKARKQRADLLFLSMPMPSPTGPLAAPRCLPCQKGATSSAARYLAQTQNESDLIGGVSLSGDRYLDSTMFDMVQTLTINDSLKFGKEILHRLGTVNHLHKTVSIRPVLRC